MAPSVSLAGVTPGRLLPELCPGAGGPSEGLQATPAATAGLWPCRALVEVGTAAAPPPWARLRGRPHSRSRRRAGGGGGALHAPGLPRLPRHPVALFPPLCAKLPGTDVRHRELHRGGSLIFSYFFTRTLELRSGILLNHWILLGVAFLRFVKWDQSSMFWGLIIFRPGDKVLLRLPRAHGPETS